MAIQDNSPTFSYVKLDGISVIWNNEIFTVKDFATNKKYIYWNADIPNQLNASNVMPNRSNIQHLVLINDNGVSTIVPPTDESFSISFDGNSEQAIKEKIFGLYAKNEELGEKFVAIEQDIDGIKQIIGETGGSDPAILERVSKLEQKADEISLSVKEVQKEYNDSKEASQLREDLNSSIIKINSIIGIFKSEITEYFKDNEVTSDEVSQVRVQIELLENAKSDFDSYIDKVILIAEENGQAQDVISLTSSKQSLNNIHQTLKNSIENAIIDNIITTTELTVIINAFAQYNTKINEIKNTCDEIIILGLGGIITEELARIDVKSDEIKLSVSNVESNFKSDMSIQKIELEKQIEDVSSALNSFEENVNTIFKDGIIDETEKQILSEKISNTNKEKSDIDARFLAICNDENLSSEINESLSAAYENYVTQHNQLIEKIEYVISDDIVNDAEKLEVDTLFKKYSNALSSFSVIIAKAIEDISLNSSKVELEQAKNELQNEINEVKGSIEGIENVLDGTFEDNILDEVERKNIQQDLENLAREKIDIDNIYTNLYESEFLLDIDKFNFKNSYDEFIVSYNEVVSISNNILNKDTLIDDIDKVNLSKAIASYKEKLNLFFIQANTSNEIISNNKSDNLKNEFNKDLNDINDKIDDVLGNIDLSIVDGIIDEVEIKIIEESLNNLNKEKMDVDAKYLVIYENEYLDGQLKEDLFNIKTYFDASIEVVIQTISNMILDGNISEEERENFDLAREEFNLNSAELNKKFEEVTEYISKKMVEDTQLLLEKEINDLNGAILGLEDTMNGAFLDGVLSESEKLSIKQHLLTLSSEKCDIDKQYTTISSNELLEGEVKSNLVSSYNNYVSSYNSLVSTINNILEKNTIVDSTDRKILDNAFKSHSENLGVYTENAITALDYLSQKKAEVESEKVDKKYAEIILDPESGIVSKVEHINSKISGDDGLEQRIQSAEEKISPDGIAQTVMNSQLIKDIQSGITTNRQNISYIDQRADSISLEVSKKVGTNSIISAINQTAESIRINASKINLSGYVTFSELGDYVTEDDLGYYGTTSIHGNRIRTGTLSVDKIGASSSSPIIQLFYGNGLNCALDATAYMNEGVGNAIRLKRDDSNYIYVGQGNIAFYCTGSNNDESALCSFQGDTSSLTIRSKGGELTLNSGVYYDGSQLLTSSDLSSSTSSSSTGIPANSYAVKQAYDKANSAYSRADSAYSRADSAYDKANHDHPYAKSNHTHDKINYSSSYGVESYSGYNYFRCGSSTLRHDNGASGYGWNYKFAPTTEAIDLGNSNDWQRWRYLYVQTVFNSSDERHKENITYLDEVNTFTLDDEEATPFLDFIKNDFRPATFDYKIMREEEGRLKSDSQVGFIANDIINSQVGQTFLYDFGTEEESDIMYSPSGYTTVVAKALQEEIQVREKLEEEVSNLKNEIKNLKEIVSMLQDKITV